MDVAVAGMMLGGFIMTLCSAELLYVRIEKVLKKYGK